MCFRPVSASASISLILSAVLIGPGSIWKPSRGPSSWMSAWVGRSVIFRFLFFARCHFVAVSRGQTYMFSAAAVTFSTSSPRRVEDAPPARRRGPTQVSRLRGRVLNYEPPDGVMPTASARSICPQWRTILDFARNGEKVPGADFMHCSKGRSYSISSSTRARSVGGMSTPSVLAILRLRTNSNLLTRSIGRSWGFSPRRSRSA